MEYLKFFSSNSTKEKKNPVYSVLYTKQKPFSVLPNYGRHRTSFCSSFQEYFQEHEKLENHQKPKGSILVQVLHLKLSDKEKVNWLVQD